MGVYMRVDEQQQTTNTFTLDAFTSQEMQEWLADYAPDLSVLANVLPQEVYNAIEYQYNQITGNTFTDASVGDVGTITGENGGVISATSSPTITNMDVYPLVICLPVNSSGNIIENIQYIYENSNRDIEFPLTQYQTWNSLGAVAVDIFTLI